MPSLSSKYYNDPEPYSELKITGTPLFNQGEFGEQENKRLNHHFVASPSPPLKSSRTALLIVDVQPEYWSECPAVREDFPHFPSCISSLIEHCRSQKTKCIWVRADYSYEKSPWLQQFSRLHEGRIPPIVKPSTKWEDFAEPSKGEFVMNKNSWSSTSNTQLLDILRDNNIDTVLVCGLITSVCVQHSAFGVFEAGFRTILVTDCCADRGKARQDAALALYGGYMYELRTVDSVKEELRASCADSRKVSVRIHESIVKTNHSSGDTSSTSTGSLSTIDSEHKEEDEGRDDTTLEPLEF